VLYQLSYPAASSGVRRSVNARGPHGTIQAGAPGRAPAGAPPIPTIIAGMRRSLIAVLVVALSAGAAGPAVAELTIAPSAVRMVVPAESRGGESATAFAARTGCTYRFEVSYDVAGAPRIGTGHVFAFEEAVTGRRMKVVSKRFAPEPPGAYRESSELRIPGAWEPGVYRLRWAVTARSRGLAPARATGTRVFLVVR
jgi:hypothetical protein